MHAQAQQTTWYQHTAHAAPTRPPLRATCEVDVCIVGGGLAGLSCALELLRRGRSVALLESGSVGWAASGRNGGFVSTGYACRLSLLEQKLGLDHARELFALSVEGRDSVAENIAALGLDDCIGGRGKLVVRRYPSRDEQLRTRDHYAQNYGHQLEFVEREPLAELLHTERYHHALRDARAFHFQPLDYCRALGAEIERLGGQIFEDSAMQTLDRKGTLWRVRTAAGEVLARDVVLCGGGYSGRAFGRVHHALLPIATYVIATEPLGERAAAAIETREAILDDRRASDYYRLVGRGADTRLLWGGRITASTRDPDGLGELLRADMLAVYPQLAGVRVEFAWSGLMAYARHQMPIIGPVAEQLWACTGFGGHGMNTAPIGARLVAEGLCGESDRHRLFAPFGPVWNGGPAGPLAANAVYAWLRLGDWWHERA